MALINVIESNAIELQELQAEIKRAWSRRGEPAQDKAWREACARFHASYDHLAFPGGLGKAMSMLETNDPTTIETTVRFLEVDPWFFRSGYLKTEFIKRLCRAPLNEDQRKRLQQVIVARVRAKETRREFRSYCRLAPVVTELAFEKELEDIAASSGGLIARHAQWVLVRLRIVPNK
jgi:hypothetical protein